MAEQRPLPVSIETSELYKRLRENDPTNISFPPEYSPFDDIHSIANIAREHKQKLAEMQRQYEQMVNQTGKQYDTIMAEKLINIVNMYNYWNINCIDKEFIDVYKNKDQIFGLAEKQIGHLELFKVLEIICCRPDDNVHSALAARGSLFGMKLAYDCGITNMGSIYQWFDMYYNYHDDNDSGDDFGNDYLDHYVALSAVRFANNLDCLKFAIEHGSPYCDWLLCYARKHKNTEMIEYLNSIDKSKNNISLAFGYLTEAQFIEYLM